MVVDVTDIEKSLYTPTLGLFTVQEFGIAMNKINKSKSQVFHIELQQHNL